MNIVSRVPINFAVAMATTLGTPLAGLAAGEQSLQEPKVAVIALKRLTLEELGNIEVTTADKQPEVVWRTAAAIHVITQDDIRRSGATTLPDVLRLAPGVIVNQSDSNRWAVGVRGFADIFSKNVLVLIDGRSVYSPFVGGVHWAIQDVVLADVQQIEVVRGAGGSVWGANAVNGVINVITKSAQDTHGARLTAAAGSVEHGRVSVRYGGGTAGNWDYRVYGKWFTRGAQFHPDGANFDEWRSGQAGVRTEWRPTLGRLLTVSADIYDTRAGERAQVSFFSPPRTENIDGTIAITGGNVLVRWEQQLAGGTRTHLQTYYDGTDRSGFTFREVRHTFDVDFNVRLPVNGRHQLAFGVGTRLSPSVVTQVVPTLNFLPNEHTHVLASGFVQDDIRLLKNRLSLTIGTKVEHNTYTGAEFLPSAQLLWSPRPDQSLWTSLTRAVRTPSRFERDLSFQVLLDPTAPAYLAIAGNPAFASESVWGAEVGYRRLVMPTLYLDVVGFHNSYDQLAGLGDPRVSAESGPVPHLRVTVPFENAVEAKASGFEISPDWKPRPSWHLRGSYSYGHVSAKNKPPYANTVFRDNYVGLAPRHQVRVQSRLDLPGRLELDQIYRFVDTLPAQHVPRYHTLDARVGWRVSDRVELSVVGQNLFEPHHAEFNAVPVEIRRSGYVQIAIRR